MTGVGGSQGKYDDGVGELTDVKNAFAFLTAAGITEIHLAGYSFGAAAALRIALREPSVRELVLVAPPATMIRTLPLEQLGQALHILVGSEDLFSPPEVLSEILAPPPNARLEVIPGADHFFAAGGLAELSELARTAMD